MKSLVDAFPENVQHTHAFAVKASPICGVLQIAKKCGMGAECASWAEVQHSMQNGFEPGCIVFDSPCKTLEEIRLALHHGVYTNLDNPQEVEAVAEMLSPKEKQIATEKRLFGLRLNPALGSGSISTTSTATSTSKFGIPLHLDSCRALVELYERNSWLVGVHCHVGSQGCPIQMLVDGVKVLLKFVQQVDLQCGTQIKVMDIGGGMPTDYESNKEAHSYGSYVKLLQQQTPELFNGRFRIITEFGRSLVVKAGFTAMEVQYTKQLTPELQVAIAHVGANQFIREAYLPKQWVHTLTVHDKFGNLKGRQGEKWAKQDVAGPLCFSGDYLAKGRMLPIIMPKDLVVMHDTGGYCMAMYSRYNSRPAGAVYGYRVAKDGSGIKFFIFKEREKISDVLQFWGPVVPIPVLATRPAPSKL